MRPMRSDSSNCVMTSLFTTATMRSTSSIFPDAGARGAAGVAGGAGAAAGAGAGAAALPCAGAATGHTRAAARSILSIRRDPISVKRPRRLVGRRRRAEGLVARDVSLQRFERIRPDAGEAVQLQLEKQRARRRARGQGEMLDHDARYPATRIVFDPGQRFDDSLVARRVVEAADAVPAASQRPLRGDVDLRDLVAQVAVAEIHRMQ